MEDQIFRKDQGISNNDKGHLNFSIYLIEQRRKRILHCQNLFKIYTSTCKFFILTPGIHMSLVGKGFYLYIVTY